MTTRRRMGAAVAGLALATGITAVPNPAAAETGATIGYFETTLAGEQQGHEISGIAIVVRTPNSTFGRVVVFGLEPGVTYAAHLHNAPCDQNVGGGHYKHDPRGPGEPPNELWFSSTSDPFEGVTANRAGIGVGRGSAEWQAGETAVAVVIHSIPEGGSTAGGPKIACADLA